MDKIKIELENCFGIKELNYIFDFSSKKVYSIYAPNGTMKTSFAKTMKCIADEEKPKDLINIEKMSNAIISKSNGKTVIPDEVMIIDSYKEDYESKRVSTLMVNKELKLKYDKIHASLEEKKENLLKGISQLCGIRSKSNIECELTNTWGKSQKEIFECLEEIESLIEGVTFPINIKYKIIINDNVIDFLKDRTTRALIKEYIEKYDELITKSDYFTKGVFNHNNVNSIAKNLNDNGFFKVKNKIFISDKEIKSKKELDILLENEKNKIFNDKDLITRFENLDKVLTKNGTLKEFRDLLEKNPELISKLDNIELLKKELWLSYLKQKEEELKTLNTYYKSSKESLKKILQEAQKQKTTWNEVVEIFNQRFNVPFITEVSNKEDVVLKEVTPTINFKYNCDGNFKDVDKMTLLNVLSNGEKRALYILNIIFEVQALIRQNKDVLVVIDDIADSFDYKNKYAIIEYLNDILKSGIFRMIILTHNFDFYRTIASRLVIPRKNCLMAQKNDKEVKLVQGQYLKNIFDVWKNEIGRNDRIMIASIPFVRNLSEYLDMENSRNYIKLTSLLHLKDDTISITVKELESIYNEVWRVPKNLSGKHRKVIEVLFNEAEAIVLDTIEKINLENKIVLSIAIRLLAEEFMKTKIKDKNKIKTITSNQTFELFRLYKDEYDDIDVIKILEQVNLMTPENIHINSFMYEPILDLSDIHLKKLYSDIKEMKNLACKEVAAIS